MTLSVGDQAIDARHGCRAMINSSIAFFFLRIWVIFEEKETLIFIHNRRSRAASVNPKISFHDTYEKRKHWQHSICILKFRNI